MNTRTRGKATTGSWMEIQMSISIEISRESPVNTTEMGTNTAIFTVNRLPYSAVVR